MQELTVLDMERVEQFAEAAHDGQTRKGTGTPYIEHPRRVAAQICRLGFEGTSLEAAAFLHDVVEDTEFDAADIWSEFGDEVSALVVELTEPLEPEDGWADKRTKYQGKEDYLRDFKSKTPEAVLIKLCDRDDNLNDWVGMAKGSRKGYALEAMHLVQAVVRNKRVAKLPDGLLRDAIHTMMAKLMVTIMECQMPSRNQ